MKLVTLKEYLKLDPKTQGYVVYMQADWPESQLHGMRNPYRKNSAKWHEFENGQMMGVLEAQDNEE